MCCIRRCCSARWPEGDPRTSRIVFITQDLPRAVIEARHARVRGRRRGVNARCHNASLPVQVRNEYDDALGLIFDHDDVAVAAINSALRHVASRRAA